MPPAVGYADDQLGHRERDQQDQPADDRPAPRDRDRPAVVPRLPVGGEAAREDRDDRERDREVREPAPRSLQVLLVAELREPPFVVALLLRRPSRSCPTSAKRYAPPSLDRERTGARQGSRPARTCSVPRRWSAMIAHRRSPGRAARGSRRAGRAARWPTPAPRAGGRCSGSGRSSRPGPRSSPPPARRSRSPRRGRCGRARRPAGRRRSRRAGASIAATSASSRSIALGLGPLGGQHGDAELDRQPHVAAVAPVGEHLGARRLGDRRRVGDERPAAAAAHGDAGARTARARSAPGAASSARSRAARTGRARRAAACRARAGRA